MQGHAWKKKKWINIQYINPQRHPSPRQEPQKKYVVVSDNESTKANTRITC